MPAKKKSAAKRAPKKAPVAKPGAGYAALFDRVATILEQARANVVRAVNSHMVLAYWLIGREIVQEIQGGGDDLKFLIRCNNFLQSADCKTTPCSR